MSLYSRTLSAWRKPRAPAELKASDMPIQPRLIKA
jgi:hypothetical protein